MAMDVRSILLPQNSILMPGVVLQMPLPLGPPLTIVDKKVFKESKKLMPFLRESQSFVVVIPRKPESESKPGYNNTVATFARVLTMKDEGPAIIQGLCRAQVLETTYKSIDSNGATLSVLVSSKIKLIANENLDSAEVDKVVDQLQAAVGKLLSPNDGKSSEIMKWLLSYTEGISPPVTMIDILTSVLPLEFAMKYRLLQERNPSKRISLLTSAINERVAAKGKEVQQSPTSKALASLKRSNLPTGGLFGGSNSKKQDDDGFGELSASLAQLRLPEEGRKIVDREVARLKRMTPAQADYQVARNFLETVNDIPWNNDQPPRLSKEILSEARKVFNADHYGLEKVKKRLVEYLAVMYLQQQQLQNETQLANGSVPVEGKLKAPIILLVGPPGVGKTSLAKSVANALDRKLHRISLGGVRDEAEIRGHRRTYIGAMPGCIVQGLRKAGTMSPVFVLDEIDKLSGGGRSPHGDPAAALLEVLDPEQNSAFVDHFVSFPVNLSQSLFIATANSTDTIPGPLLDRMEVIHLSGYTFLEKQYIADNYLLPKQLKANALEPDQIRINSKVLNSLVVNYTRESGVRSLDRALGAICRGRAVELLDSDDHSASMELQTEDLTKYLGLPRPSDEMINDEADFYEQDGRKVRRHLPGIVNGLAYMGSGNGGLLMFEAAKLPTTRDTGPKLQLTGKLGEVIKESAEIALSWVKTHASDLNLTDELKNCDIHLHAPAGAIPKDGPSAGVAMTLCFISLLSNKEIPRDIAMTGEMTLRGKILPVGGIREKLLGAHFAGVKKVILPFHCQPIVLDECKFVEEIGLEIVYAKYIWDVLNEVWGGEAFPEHIQSYL